jgi:hypothetical protein
MTTDKTLVQILPVEAWNELCCHYDRQTTRQPCFVELDCQTGTLTARYNPEIGNAIPCSVWHGHEQRWDIPCLTADAANELMDDITPLAQRVLDGYSSEWDGSNHVAHFTADAHAASEEIAETIDAINVSEDNGVSCWDAGDWLNSSTVDGLGADTDDDGVAALARQFETEAAEQNIVLRGTEEYLAGLRDAMRDSNA